MTLSSAKARLLAVIKLLALPASEQQRHFPAFVLVPDELALLLEDAILLAEDWGVWQEFPDEFHQAVIWIDDMFKQNSLGKSQAFWTIDALKNNETWSTIRETTSDVLKKSGQENVSIQPAIDIYIKSD